MISFIKIPIRWPAGHLIFLVIPFIAILTLLIITMFSCNQSKPLQPLIITMQDSLNKKKYIVNAFKSIAAIKNSIHSGDVVTRTGNDFTSQSLRTLNQRNKTYSHCGIASIENDSLFVYHAIGGEWNPDEKLKRDSYELFAEPYSNKGIGVFSFAMPKQIKLQLINICKKYYHAGVMFDMDFDLNTDNKMYCAEFVYKSFLTASNNHIIFNKSNIGNFIFIGVDDIFLHPHCKITTQIVYK